MALAFQRNEVSVEVTGQVTTVPNNDVARLMYYLNCVCTVIDCNNDAEIQRFTNYRNYYSLSITEQAQLVVACYTFSPDVFDDKVFFQSDELCGDSSNEFYRINQVRHQLLASESIIIAGQVRQVNQIMTYKMQWMQNNYFGPMERFASRLGNSSRATTYGSTPRAVTYGSTPRATTYDYDYDYRPRSSCTSGRIAIGILCVLIIIPAIIAGIVIAVLHFMK